MKNIFLVSTLLLSVSVQAQSRSLCDAFRSAYEGEEAVATLVEKNSVESKDTTTLPQLTDSEKYMAQMAVLLNRASDPLNIQEALESFFLGSGGDGEGAITYFTLKYKNRAGKDVEAEVAQAKFYGGDNPIGAVYRIIRLRNGHLHAELMGRNSDDSISCLSYE